MPDNLRTFRIIELDILRGPTADPHSFMIRVDASNKEDAIRRACYLSPGICETFDPHLLVAEDDCIGDYDQYSLKKVISKSK